MLSEKKKNPNPLVILWFPCFKEVNVMWAVWRLSSAASVMEGKDEKQNQICWFIYFLHFFSPCDFSCATLVVQVVHYTNEKAPLYNLTYKCRSLVLYVGTWVHWNICRYQLVPWEAWESRFYLQMGQAVVYRNLYANIHRIHPWTFASTSEGVLNLYDKLFSGPRIAMDGCGAATRYQT